MFGFFQQQQQQRNVYVWIKLILFVGVQSIRKHKTTSRIIYIFE